MACLDTSLLLDLSGRGGRKRRERAREKVRELIAAGATLATTRFNVAELWVGIHRAPDPDRERESVERLLRPLTVLDFDEASARAFGRLIAYLQERGTPLGDMDVLIASIALVSGHPIVTHDPRHFAPIPGLACSTY